MRRCHHAQALPVEERPWKDGAEGALSKYSAVTKWRGIGHAETVMSMPGAHCTSALGWMCELHASLLTLQIASLCREDNPSHERSANVFAVMETNKRRMEDHGIKEGYPTSIVLSRCYLQWQTRFR